jgi:N-acetylglucosamine-6-phosphate deacetylase
MDAAQSSASPLLLRGTRILGRAGSTIRLEAGRIASIGGDGRTESRASAVELDGCLVTPGFIDLQLNGAAGHDFTTEPDAMWVVGPALARTGVTAFLPTLVSAAPDAIIAAIAAWRGRPANPAGAAPLGLHLEGPYLSPARHGAHPIASLRAPDAEEARPWSPASGVRIVTLAPELRGALDLAAALHARGVVVAAGHTDASVDLAAASVRAGFRYVTHAFNAMRGLDHRRPGILAGLLADPAVVIGLIADGHHVADELLGLVERVAGSRRISLVTDAIALGAAADGVASLAGAEAAVRDGAARLRHGTLAGSVATLDACVRRMASASGIGIEAAVEAVTRVPARLLGATDGRGTIRRRGRADLTVLDEAGEVVATIIGGRLAYARDSNRWPAEALAPAGMA